MRTGLEVHDGFLTQSAQNLPSTLLARHYRTRYQSLIGFSNAAFYSGNLFTIPNRQRALDNQVEIRVAVPDQGAANVQGDERDIIIMTE